MNTSRLSSLFAIILFATPVSLIIADAVVIIPIPVETNNPTLTDRTLDAVHTATNKAKEVVHVVANKTTEIAYSLTDKAKEIVHAAANKTTEIAHNVANKTE